MKTSRTRSLTSKLVLFLIAFSIPALLAVEVSVLSFEYAAVVGALDGGALDREAKELAQQISVRLDDPPEEIRLRLNNARLMLQDPHSTWIGEPYVLTELSVEPIRITLRRANGSLWVAANGDVMVAESGAHRWKSEAVVPGAPEFVRIELALSPPWRRMQSVFSFEWPVMVACLLLVGVGAGIFLHRVVLRRLDRIAVAAEGWSRERFASQLKDDSSDEIGALTRRLNHVAGALRARMEERARLAVLEERERLAQDLHDSVKQHGFALELQLGALAAVLPKFLSCSINEFNNSSAFRALEESQLLSVQIRRDLDIILGQLRISDDSVEGVMLDEALSGRIDDFTRRSGISCSFQARCDKPSNLSATDLAGALRIVDEALANVWRHSGATHARIVLNGFAGAYQLEIIDNGCGFELASALLKDSMGLKNLSDRARRLPSGRLNIHTAVANARAHSLDKNIGENIDKSSGDQMTSNEGIGTKVELQWLE